MVLCLLGLPMGFTKRLGEDESLKELYWEPKQGTPIVGIEWEDTYQGPHILFYSCYILGVPCLGFPVKSL